MANRACFNSRPTFLRLLNWRQAASILLCAEGFLAKRLMRGIAIVGLAIFAAMFSLNCCFPDQSALGSQGEYLTTIANCAGCHTAPGGAPFAGGYEMKLPMGTLYTSNITPDVATGIGAWTDDEFVRAMQQGISRDGRHLYPAFPYTSYTLMSRSDILAIKAYLFSLKPVHNVPPPSHMAFPYNMRWLMAVWTWFFLSDRRFQTDPQHSPQWNRGAYLVQAVAHCGDCHTPRSRFTQAVRVDEFLGGGLIDGWSAYNITSDLIAGIGAWSDEDIKRYLLTGAAPGKAWAEGPMGLAVASTRHLTMDDAESLIAYLRTVSPVRDSGAISRSAAADIPRDLSPSGLDRMPGAGIYDLYCANCHGSGRVAVTDLYPSMANESAVGAMPPENLIMIIRQGAENDVTARGGRMPSFTGKFNDRQIADLVNYLEAQYGDPAMCVTPEDVGKWRAGKVDLIPTRRTRCRKPSASM
jgi:mono/diheme cytochrome c family protein